MKKHNIDRPLSLRIFQQHYFALAKRTDQLFAKLLVFQWFFGIALALWVSPQAWMGSHSFGHLHVYAAFFGGGLLSGVPLWLIRKQPGDTINRMVIAAAQMGYSILFIHLTGGRIETHFHIFGSLAFLSFYRDSRPLLIATVITAADHFLRGALWPESIYGVAYASPLRALEHIFWVLFADIILCFSIKNGIQEMQALADHGLELELTLKNIERLVDKRTNELQLSQKTVLEQQETLLHNSKMSALGEMASCMAHEINNPVGIIQGKANLLVKHAQTGSLTSEMITEQMGKIIAMTHRLTKIVSGLKSYARNADGDPLTPQNLQTILENVISLCHERLQSHHVELRVGTIPNVEVNCRISQIEQVLVNLLNNAHDAIEAHKNKWIEISIHQNQDSIEIWVTDCGQGIPPETVQKMMQPFFTTKSLGKGTGLGLSISKDILEQHSGHLTYDQTCPNTRFIVHLPICRIRKSA